MARDTGVAVSPLGRVGHLRLASARLVFCRGVLRICLLPWAQQQEGGSSGTKWVRAPSVIW